MNLYLWFFEIENEVLVRCFEPIESSAERVCYCNPPV